MAVKYTEYGVRHGKGDRRAANQWGVVRAVRSACADRVRTTLGNFTRTSLAQDGMIRLVITNTYNPSWYGQAGNTRAVLFSGGGACRRGQEQPLLPQLGANPRVRPAFNIKRLPNHAADLTVAYLYYRDTECWAARSEADHPAQGLAQADIYFNC